MFRAFLRKRRATIVDDRIKRMLLVGTSYAGFEDLYFEAARAYAIDNGANRPEHDSA